MHAAVSIRYRRVTDMQTDERTDGQMTVYLFLELACIVHGDRPLGARFRTRCCRSRSLLIAFFRAFDTAHTDTYCLLHV